MHARTLQALEFGKIIDILSSFCISEQGKINCQSTKPSTDISFIKKECNLFEEFQTWRENSGKDFIFKSFPNILPIIDNVSQKKAFLDKDAFWALKNTLNFSSKAIESISHEQGSSLWPNLFELSLSNRLPLKLISALNRCISDDAQLTDKSSPELLRLRSELRTLHQRCLRQVKKYAEDHNITAYLQDDYMTLSSDRYVLPVKANFKGRMQGIIHDWSQTGETCYFEPIFLIEINNTLQELKHEELAEEQRILLNLQELLLQEFSETKESINLLTKLDILQAKQKLANIFQGHCLSPDDTAQNINLIQAYHPLLLLNSINNSGQKVYPIDIILNEGEKALIITGGNAGGKTVCLKTLGLIVIMVMSAIPVPAAKHSILPIFTRVDAFIGDEQSIEDNVSTFTAQIEHLAKAWKHFDKNGLILLDEFGSGTDPAQGSALAQAVIDELMDKQTYTLAATHFPNLKFYALKHKKIRAASMLFDQKTNKPLFKLAYDQIGKSHAIAVAREHGLDEKILKRAENYLGNEDTHMAQILDKLNALSQEKEEELKKLQEKQVKFEEKNKKAILQLSNTRETLCNEIQQYITTIMQEWRQNKLSAKQAMQELKKEREKILSSQKEKQKKQEEFKIGQTVDHLFFNKQGIITAIDKKRGRLQLDMNGITMWTDIKDIKTALKNEPKDIQQQISSQNIQCNMRIDVRGLRSDQAILEIESFLDKALVSGKNEVEIVHGRGTGALRQQIHVCLQQMPFIDHFSLANEDQGGDGMTIVNLK